MKMFVVFPLNVESDIAAARLRLSCRRQPKRVCAAFRRKAERSSIALYISILAS